MFCVPHVNVVHSPRRSDYSLFAQFFGVNIPDSIRQALPALTSVVVDGNFELNASSGQETLTSAGGKEFVVFSKNSAWVRVCQCVRPFVWMWARVCVRVRECVDVHSCARRWPFCAHVNRRVRAWSVCRCLCTVRAIASHARRCALD